MTDSLSPAEYSQSAFLVSNGTLTVTNLFDNVSFGQTLEPGEGGSTVTGLNYQIYFADVGHAVSGQIGATSLGGTTVLQPLDGAGTNFQPAHELIIKDAGGDQFRLTSLFASDGGGGTVSYTVTGFRDGVQVANETFVSPFGGNSGATVNLGGDFRNVDEVRLTAFNGVDDAIYDGFNSFVFADPVGPAELTGASYDAAAGVLTISGTDLTVAGSYDPTRLSVFGENGLSHALTGGAIGNATASGFTLTLNAADQLAVNGLLNKDGGTAVNGTAFALAAAAGWDVSGNGAPDTIGNPITVSNVSAPSISSATYNAATHVLSVTGTGLVATPGANNDINVAKLQLTGEDGHVTTLTSTGVEVTSATSFSVTLNGADANALQTGFNKNGNAATSGQTYNLAALDDWNGVITGNDTAVSTAPVAISNIGKPVINSASVNLATGVVTVSGSNLFILAGANNDIDPTKLSFTGEGGQVVQLSDSAAVDITSPTSFSFTLGSADRAALAQILNSNGAQSTTGTSYVLNGGEDWAAGADPAVVVADAANTLSVNNVPTPTIASSTYDAASGVLTVSGANFTARAGADNDIVASKLTLVGEGGASYTLLDTADVDISSAGSFALTIGSADQAGLAALFNRAGSTSTGGTTYNLAAAEDWAAGANAAVTVADVSGNGVAVSNLPSPAITSASYDAASGQLTVSGSGFAALAGAGNDIVATALTLRAEGGDPYTLSDSANVDISTSGSFTITLGAADREALATLINKNGASASSGDNYQLSAAEDWNAGADPALSIVDMSGNAVSAANVAVPVITSAAFDAASGTLVVSGSGFTHKAGSANDIDVTRFTLTGEGGATYTLTDSQDVDITSSTAFTITLSSGDLEGLDTIITKNGASAADNTSYALAAAEDWAAGADAAVAVADLTGNGLNASGAGGPVITSALYDASSNLLTVTGSHFTAQAGALNDIVVSHLTLTGQGGSYTLTSADVDIASSSSSSFSVALNAVDAAYVEGLLNKDGASAGDGTAYNLGASAGWQSADAGAVDLSGNAVAVAATQAPALTSAQYDAATGTLVVSSANVAHKSGAANDIDASRLAIVGEGGVQLALTDTPDVDVAADGSFTLILSAADRAAVNLIVNRDGMAATGGSAYNLVALDDWAGAADAGANIADSGANAISVAAVAQPLITAAQYDAQTGVLSVTGGGFTTRAGAANDIIASKLVLTGEGGETVSLAGSANVDISSGSSFSLTLSAGDRAAVNQILNQNGASATGGMVFNLAALDDWAAGADAQLAIADVSANPLTVASVATPSISAVNYNAANGTLQVSGSGFVKLAGAANDIVAAKLTVSGAGSSSYTLTDSANVDISSDTSFTITLGTLDRTAIDLLFDKNGATAGDSHVYSLAAAEDWAAGAPAAVTVADAGNAVLVSGIVDTSEPPAVVVDGVPVHISTGSNPATGLVEETVRVDVVSGPRQDEGGSAHTNLADIPLGVAGAGGAVVKLLASLPSGAGLQAQGPNALLSTAQAAMDLAARVGTLTDASAATRTEAAAQSAAFVKGLGGATLLETRTLVLSSDAAVALEQPIIISATPASGTAVALVIDTHHVAPGTVIQLDHVDFAIVTGAATVRGGAGTGRVIGDDSAQTIGLGAGNDYLDGGIGNDQLAGGSGNDAVLGGAGNDSLQGGHTDVGRWDYYLDASGQLAARYSGSAAVGAGASAGPAAADAAAETFGLASLDRNDTSLAFANATPERLKAVALLYGAAFERAPDLEGLAFWARSGASLEQIGRDFVKSSEWAAGHGKMGTEALVAHLFETVTGLPGKPTEIAAVLAQLDSKAIDMGTLLSQLVQRAGVSGVFNTPFGLSLGGETLQTERGRILGSGDDLLTGGAGSDSIEGGDGVDTLVYSGKQLDYKLLLGAHGEFKVAQANGDIDRVSHVEKAQFDDATLDLGFLQAAPAALQQVGMLYQTVLGRAADVGGLTFWAKANAGAAQLAANFINSTEFQQQHANLSNAAFIELLYQNGAHHAASTGAQQQWSAYLGSHTRAELVVALTSDAEFIGVQTGTDGLWLV